jgi:hypothetical protein
MHREWKPDIDKKKWASPRAQAQAKSQKKNPREKDIAVGGWTWQQKGKEEIEFMILQAKARRS